MAEGLIVYEFICIEIQWLRPRLILPYGSNLVRQASNPLSALLKPSFYPCRSNISLFVVGILRMASFTYAGDR